MYPEIYNYSRYQQSDRRKKRPGEQGFRCMWCQAHIYTQPFISGVQNRNHCPYCMHSRHVDLEHAGDRLSACKAVMQPIGLTVKHSRNRYGNEASGEMMLIHRCNGCGKLSINRIAADDLVEKLMEIVISSTSLDPLTLAQLDLYGIRALKQDAMELVSRQLWGFLAI
jgi:hypothetical protein